MQKIFSCSSCLVGSFSQPIPPLLLRPGVVNEDLVDSQELRVHYS